MSTHNILAGALVAQIALAAVTWWPSSSAPVEPTPLLPEGAESLTAFTVSSPSGDASVSLARKDGAWVVASASDYPADVTKVTEVVDALADISLKTPIATQASSHEALGVTDEDAARKVVYTANGQEHTLWVGSAASKAVHLRVDDGAEVYKIKGLSAFTLKDNARGYLPGDLVTFDKEALSTFSIETPQGKVAFARTDGTWGVDGDPTLRPVTAELDKLLDKAAKVRLNEVVGTEVLPEQGLTSGATRVTWSTTEGDQNVPGGLTIGLEKDSAYYVKADDSSFVVLSPSYQLDALVDVDLATLVEPATPPDEAAATE